MKKRKLGEILLAAGAVSKEQLAEALRDQKRYGGKLGSILLERRHITEKEFFHALTSQLQIPAVDFSKSTIPESVIKIVPPDIAEKNNVFPIALKQTPKGRVLILAMADPTNVSIQDEIQFTTGYKVEPALALETTLRYVIRDYYYTRLGEGSYRLEDQFNDIESSSGPEGLAGMQSGGAIEVDGGMQITHERGAMEEAFPIERPEGDDRPVANRPAAADKPQLTRELKALLKILQKKGILTPREYIDEFNETE